MAKCSHSAALKTIPVSEQDSELSKDLSKIGNRVLADFRNRKAASELARKCLSAPFAGAKKWSLDLGVSERLIRMWAAGDVMIPDHRVAQIILQANFYKGRGRDLEAAIEDAVDEMLARAYGHTGRRSM